VGAVRPHGGLYCAHHRSYFEGLETAIDEVLTIGREIGVPVTLSHHQCTGAANFGKAPHTLEVIDRGRRTQVRLDDPRRLGAP
jgi:N-acyl-D-amino-acid deacylase